MNVSKKRIIFAIVYFAYTSIYIARVNLSVAGPDLISAGVLNTVQMGLLGSVFSTLYAVGRMINGSISDKTPPWIMLTTGLALAGLSNIIISFFPPFIGIFIFWTTNAFAQSMLWSSVLCVVSSLYETSEAKKKTSVMVTSVAMGNILAILINSFLITKLGASYAFAVPGFLTLVLGIAVLFSTKNIKTNQTVAKKHISIRNLLKDKSVLTMGIPAVFHGVMKENISLWMAVFVVDKYSVDLSTSSYYILLIPFVGFIGRTLYPFFYKICKEKENSVSFLGFLLCISASLLLCAGKINMLTAILAMSVIYAAVSMINTSILSIFPLRYVSTGNVASISGIMDFATYLGGGIASFIYGIVIKSFGYTPMFISWIIISVISACVVLHSSKNGE